MEEYKTCQRKALIDFFKQHCDCCFSVEEIAKNLCCSESISKSAVYRNIDKLVKEGSLQRIAEEGSRRFLYRYADSEKCSSHLHLKCLVCGNVFHMSDDQTNMLLAAVKKSSAFVIDSKRTLLYGMCEKCR